MEQERAEGSELRLRGLVIPWDPALEVEVRDFARLADYKAAVSGWIEPVDVPDLGVTMYVNEEGLLRRLPFNARATFLWWYHEPVARSSILVGDVVMVGARVDAELGSDLDPETIAMLTGPGEWVVRARIGIDLTGGAALPRARDVLLPISEGDPRWFVGEARYESYFDACAWAAITDAQDGVEEVELVPFPDLPSMFGSGSEGAA